MSTRIIIPILVAGALAFACGPRTHSEASSATKPPALAAAESAAPAPLLALTSVRRAGTDTQGKVTSPQGKVSSALDVRLERESVVFALNVTNASKKSVELNFPSGQQYDFVVLDSAGREVWRWAQGRMFTQALQNKMISRGETISFDEHWERPTKTGRYTVVATLNSSNYPMQQRAELLVP
jgi:hypothetical protein